MPSNWSVPSKRGVTGLAAVAIALIGAVTLQPAVAHYPAQKDVSAASTDAQFTRTPNSEELARYYPPAALAQGLAGRATLRCTADETGALSGCIVLEEWPTGWGFGHAALQMTKAFRVRPPQTAMRQDVVFPIRFAPGADAVTPASPKADTQSP